MIDIFLPYVFAVLVAGIVDVVYHRTHGVDQ